VSRQKPGNIGSWQSSYITELLRAREAGEIKPVCSMERPRVTLDGLRICLGSERTILVIDKVFYGLC
jgi:hypothetical protein